MKTERVTCARDILALSSGTMANLTGLRDYERLDELQGELALFVEASPLSFENYRKAWDAYVAEVRKGE